MKELPPLAGWPDQVHLVHPKNGKKKHKKLPHMGKKAVIKGK